MNKILFIFFFLLSFQIVNAQYPGKQNVNDSTLFTAGAIQGRGGVITGIYEDTTAANLSRIAFYEGAEIQTTDGTRWYRYNGGWVQITAGSGGGGAGQHFPDGLVFVESISLSDSTVTINPNIVWRRNDTTYTRTTSFSQDITRAAIGYYRKDIIWIDSGNVFRYTVGLEDTVSAVLPNIPYNGIQVTVIDVAGTTITIPEVPPTTNNFWQLGGNIIGVGQSNIIGTANAQDFVMQAGSSTRMTIQNSTGNILINNAIKALNNNHQIGNLQILTSGNAGATGEGITITGADQTFDMQGGSAPVDMFKFRSWQGDTSWIELTTNNKNTVSIKGGFGHPNIAGLSGSILSITPTYRFAGGLAGLDTVIGINYHSDDRDLTGAYHIGLQNYTGDVLLNRTSGSVGIHTIPNSKTILDVASTTKGVRFSPMTATQRLAISSPPAGLMVFDTDSACYFNYTGSTWVSLCRSGGSSGADSITVLFPFQSLVTGDSLYMPQVSEDSSGWLSNIQYQNLIVKVDSCVNHGDTMICYSNGIAVATSTNTVPFASTLQQAFDNSVTAGDNPIINGHGTDNFSMDSIPLLSIVQDDGTGRRSYLAMGGGDGFQTFTNAEGDPNLQSSIQSNDGYDNFTVRRSGGNGHTIEIFENRISLYGLDNDGDSSITRVGIGTTHPAVLLHVVGDGTITAAFMNGNVGIGITSAPYPLSVKASSGGNNIQLIGNASNVSSLTFNSEDNVTQYGQITGLSTELQIGNLNNNPLTFYTSGIERMRVDPNGNIGIGTATPDSAFTNQLGLWNKRGVRFSGLSLSGFDTTNLKPVVINSSGTLSKMNWPSGGSSGTVTTVGFTGGLISVANQTTTPAFTVAGTSGGIPYFSSSSTWASSAALAANALVIGGGAGAAPSTTTTGTGVLTALGINVGTAGAFLPNNGTKTIAGKTTINWPSFVKDSIPWVATGAATTVKSVNGIDTTDGAFKRIPFDYGTYTPTLTNTTNVTASTAYVCTYTRVGNLVTVYGRVDISTTAALGTPTLLGFSLPITSNITGTEDLSGAGNTSSNTANRVMINGDATNDRASVRFAAQAISNLEYRITFQYIVQ